MKHSQHVKSIKELVCNLSGALCLAVTQDWDGCTQEHGNYS